MAEARIAAARLALRRRMLDSQDMAVIHCAAGRTGLRTRPDPTPLEAAGSSGARSSASGRADPARPRAIGHVSFQRLDASSGPHVPGSRWPASGAARTPIAFGCPARSLASTTPPVLIRPISWEQLAHPRKGGVVAATASDHAVRGQITMGDRRMVVGASSSFRFDLRPFGEPAVRIRRLDGHRRWLREPTFQFRKATFEYAHARLVGLIPGRQLVSVTLLPIAHGHLLQDR